MHWGLPLADTTQSVRLLRGQSPESGQNVEMVPGR